VTDDVLQQLDIHDRDFSGVQQKLTELAEGLGERRARGTSRDGNVTATVDGNGRIVDIVVRDEAVRSSHPEMIGPGVVEAIGLARGEGGRWMQKQITALLDPNQPAPEEPSPTPPSPAARRRPRPLADEDENFEDIDFLQSEG
jgi:DNA-binding protein YbaB